MRQQWQTAAAVLMMDAIKQQPGYEQRGRLWSALDSRQALEDLHVLPVGGSPTDLATPLFSQAAVRGALLRATLPSQQRGLPGGTLEGILGGTFGAQGGGTGPLRGGWGGPSLSMALPSTQDAVLVGRGGGGRYRPGGAAGAAGVRVGRVGGVMAGTSRRGRAVDSQLSLDPTITVRHAYGRKRSAYVVWCWWRLYIYHSSG